VKWQKDWVQEKLLMKERGMSKAQCLYLEKEEEWFVNEGNAHNTRIEELEDINGEPMVYVAVEEAEVAEKRAREKEDEGDNNRGKRVFDPAKPPKILKRGAFERKEKQQ